MDARDLFDASLFEELIQGVFLHYYHGFVGRKYVGTLPFDVKTLASRMIDEMGVDRYMEEILRIQEQHTMTDDQFTQFLTRRGCSESEWTHIKKGTRDISLTTGPHLGGFNERISLPELIETLATVSALCVLDRYFETCMPSRMRYSL